MIGFGTYKLNKDEAYNMTLHALKIGYRFFDTAEIYRNEKSVQKAFNDCGIPRDQIFLTTKLSVKDENKIEKSLKDRLKIFPKIDLVLLHWASYDHIAGWKKLIELQKIFSDKIKYIGMSNISKNILLDILRIDIHPYAIQNEINPYCNDTEFFKICKNENIKLIAHSCFSFGNALVDQDIIELSNKVGYTPVQILLRWAKEHSDIILTRCNDINFLKENYDILQDINIPYIDIKTEKKIRLYYFK